MTRGAIGNKIDQLAAEWVARLDGKPPDAASRRALQAWLDADARHHGAYVRAQAVWRYLERHPPALNADECADEDMGEPRGHGGRRRRLIGGAIGALLAAFVVVWLGGDNWFAGREQTLAWHYATQARQIDTILLGDGSKAVVNANTTLAVTFDRQQRLVELTRGESWFKVARDGARPFVVQAGNVNARALGTAFSVNRLPAAVEVIVTEGVVEIASPRGRVEVEPGARARISANGAIVVTALGPTGVERDLAWRTQRIIFDGETLADAAQRFNALNDIQIHVEDGAHMHEKLVGSFHMYDPARFAYAVGQIFSLDVKKSDSRIVIAATD